MAQVDYLHLCDLAFMDEAGKHCIIGMFDIVRAISFPCTHPTMTVAMRVLSQPGEAIKLKFELGRPNGNVIVTLPMDIVAGPDGGANINLNLQQVQFPEAGRYTLKIVQGQETLASRSIRLQKIDPPQQAPPAPQSDKKKLH